MIPMHDLQQQQQQQQLLRTVMSSQYSNPLSYPYPSPSLSMVPPTMSSSNDTTTTNNKEAFEKFDNVDPQGKLAFDHANTIIDKSNQDKTFSVFSIPPREALAYYIGVEEHYQKEQIKPVCPLCLRQVQFSALSVHVVSCAEYRNALMAMEESPPIKSLPRALGSTSSISGPFMQDLNSGPLLGKRKKLDINITPSPSHTIGGIGNMTNINTPSINPFLQ